MSNLLILILRDLIFFISYCDGKVLCTPPGTALVRDWRHKLDSLSKYMFYRFLEGLLCICSATILNKIL